MRAKLLFSSICLAAALTATSASATDIDTTGADIETIFAFGSPDTATYGQTFTPGAGDGVLSSFSLFLRNRFDGTGTLDLQGFIGSWDGSKVGSILYTSGTQTMNATGALQEFAFSPGLSVTAGLEYVAFLSVSGLSSQPGSQFGMPNGGDGTAGAFVFINNGTNFSALTSDAWTQGYAGDSDVWFKADFDAASGSVPEPATWAMMIIGFAAVGAAMRKQRQAVRFNFA